MAPSVAAPEEDTSVGQPPAVSSIVRTLKSRSEFIRASHGYRRGTKGLHLQGHPRGDGAPHIGVGFTCSKKVGNAVARNRAKRRLREIARAVLPEAARPGWNYVLVGRPVVTGTRAYDAMQDDLIYALGKVHAAADMARQT